jgi:RNA polymerase sigma-70 factor (ECF subfamily)
MRDPDEDLLVRIGAGDAGAAASLVRRHLSRILALSRRMLSDPTEAEDVSQEVFLKVWRQAPLWRPGQAKFETWIYRVALNLCLDRLRRRRRNMGEVSPDLADPTASATRPLEDAERRGRVQVALARLPERQRAALILCYYDECSNIEASRHLGVSVEALESLLARARRGLKRELAAERGELMGALDGD